MFQSCSARVKSSQFQSYLRMHLFLCDVHNTFVSIVLLIWQWTEDHYHPILFFDVFFFFLAATASFFSFSSVRRPRKWKPSLLPFVLCSNYTKSVATWREPLRMFLCKLKLRSCEYKCVHMCMCVYIFRMCSRTSLSSGFVLQHCITSSLHCCFLLSPHSSHL